MEQAKLARGKKWKEARDLAAFNLERAAGTQEALDWFDSQPSIVEDIKAYEDSIKPEEKTKSKGKK